MAIAHVSTSSSSTQGAGGVDNESLTFSLSSGTGRKIFVRFGMDQTTPFGDVDTVTFDGQACTLVGGARLDNGSFETTCFLYYYDVPDATSSGNKTAAVTFTDTTVDIALVVSEFTGIALGDASSTDFDEVTSGNTSCALTAPTGNSIGVDVAAANVIANLTVAGTDQVERVEVDVDDYTLSTSETAFSTSGAKTMVWSYSTGGRRVQVAGLWAEAAPAASDIAATLASTGAVSAALVGSGALSATAAAAQTTSATLGGTGALAASPVATLATSGALTGNGDLSATAAAAQATAGTLTADGALGATVGFTQTTDGTLSGDIPASSTVGSAVTISAALEGTAELAASVAATLAIGGTLDQPGPITATVGATSSVSAVLFATGQLSGSLGSSVGVTAELTALGALTAAVSANLAVSGTLFTEDIAANVSLFSGVSANLTAYLAFAASVDAALSVVGTLGASSFTYPFEPRVSPAFATPFEPANAASPVYPEEPSNVVTTSSPHEPSVSPPFVYPFE